MTEILTRPPHTAAFAWGYKSSGGLGPGASAARHGRHQRPGRHRNTQLMAFSSVRGSQVISAATCALASGNHSPAKTIRCIFRTSLLGGDWP